MDSLTGLRVLVVEDEGSVALLIESMLEDLGCEVAVSVASLTKALKAAQTETLDFAVLDVNLGGELVFPVAEVLRGRQLPFIFSTGYGRVGVPETFKDYEVLNKPYTIEDLRATLLSMFNNGRSLSDA
ncbi:CheY-like chemotaxis protein [Bosea sp. OAE752]|uniref:response regulator n=1 Tax=Bosea sp. OAE752 TaxID=2663873 RepID=UPI003D19AE1D